MDNMNEPVKTPENLLEENPPPSAEVPDFLEDTEINFPDDLTDLPRLPLISETHKPFNPKVKKYLQKMAVKLTVSVLLFIGVFYAVKTENAWKDKLTPAISFVLNEQIDFSEWKDNTESMMELFYEKLFSKEAG